MRVTDVDFEEEEDMPLQVVALGTNVRKTYAVRYLSDEVFTTLIDISDGKLHRPISS